MPWPRKSSEDAIEDALVVVVLAGAPGVQGVRDQVEHDLHALRLRAVQVEALAQRADAARARLEAGAAARGHHVDQQDDAVRMLAARQEALYAQHLQPWHAAERRTLRLRKFVFQELQLMVDITQAADCILQIAASKLPRVHITLHASHLQKQNGCN